MIAPPVLEPDLGPLDVGVREINGWLDRMHAAVDHSQPGVGLVADLERVVRRVEALKLKVVARSETEATAKGAGFPDTGSWLARQTRQTATPPPGKPAWPPTSAPLRPPVTHSPTAHCRPHTPL